MSGVTLKEVCEVLMGQAPPGSSYNTTGHGLPLLAGAGDFGERFPEPKRYTTLPAHQSKVGDLILCVRATVGTLNWSDREYCLGRGVAALRPLAGVLDARFLWHWLASAREALEGKARGSTFKQVTRAAVESMVLPSIPIAEQARIADLLDRADALRRKREESRRLLGELLRSVFLEMFGDPVRNEKGWAKLTLGELAKIRRGASPRPIEQFMGGAVPWIKIGDATGSTSLFIERTAGFVTEEGARRSVLLPPGTIVVANSGVSLGFARILSISGCIHDGWLSVEELDPRVHPVYFVSLINEMTERLRAMAPKGTQPNLNTTLLKGLAIPLPPIALQERFRDVVHRIGGMKRAQQIATEHCTRIGVIAGGSLR